MAATYCTTDDFEIAPGVWTHNLTVSQVEADPTLGCCQKYVCALPCPTPFDSAGIKAQFGGPVIAFSAFFIIFGLIAGILTVKKGDSRVSLRVFFCSVCVGCVPPPPPPPPPMTLLPTHTNALTPPPQKTNNKRPSSCASAACRCGSRRSRCSRRAWTPTARWAA